VPYDLHDDFSRDLPKGRVIGTVGPNGLRRHGIDTEGVIAVRNRALRFLPLAVPGWRRAALCYGPFPRRPGLGLAVHILNADNASDPYRLPSLVRRVGRWVLGSGTTPVIRRLLRWPFRMKREGSLKRILWWRRAVDNGITPEDLGGNLAIGWFGEALPANPVETGNAWVVRGAGRENGHLFCRTDEQLHPVNRLFPNLPMHYIVVLRERGAAYYLAAPEAIPGAAPYPFMRPAGIDSADSADPVWPGVHQSVMGEIGFSAETVLYGVKIADAPGLDRWYGTAHAADGLRGDAPLADTPAEQGGRWSGMAGRFRRTTEGAVAETPDACARLDPILPSGLIHARFMMTGRGGSIALLWRLRDADNGWRLRFDFAGCHLDILVAGEVVLSRSDPTGILPPAGSIPVQIVDDGQAVTVALNGTILPALSVTDPTHADAVGIGIAAAGQTGGVLVTDFEAHPRLLPIPDSLRLGAPWTEAGTAIVIEEPFTGMRPDLDGRRSPSGHVWHRIMGSDRIELDGGGAQVVASSAQPVRSRLVYGIDWIDPDFADVTAVIRPPVAGAGETCKGRGGLIFWQDAENYFIVNTWLDNSHDDQFKNCGAVSTFFTFNGFEDVYDAIWTNLSDGIRQGRPCALRVVCDGRQYRAYVDGKPVIYRAFDDVYPGVPPLRLNRIGIVANWEWGLDTGSRFLSFTARAEPRESRFEP
jgi:hypothetical protein